MKARECPYCHQRISIKACSRYILKGKYHPIKCDHCHKEVWPPQEPIPNVLWGLVGSFTTVWVMYFFMFFMHFGFLLSLLCSLPIIALVLFTLMAIALKRMKLSKEEDT